MAAKQDLFRLIHPRREVRRPPLVRMQFLHQIPVGPRDFFDARPRLKAKDLISLLLGHWPSPTRPLSPRCRITLCVFTPTGLPAVKIRCK